MRQCVWIKENGFICATNITYSNIISFIILFHSENWMTAGIGEKIWLCYYLNKNVLFYYFMQVSIVIHFCVFVTYYQNKYILLLRFITYHCVSMVMKWIDNIL